jgi:hypothetical protein
MTAKYPRTVTAGSYPGYATETIVYYQGTGTIYKPDPARPWGSVNVDVRCDHRHADPATAQKCAGRLAERKAAQMDAETRERIKDLPCDYQAGAERGTFSGGEDLWIKFCAAHRQAAYGMPMGKTPAEALATRWLCPWDPASAMLRCVSCGQFPGEHMTWSSHQYAARDDVKAGDTVRWSDRSYFDEAGVVEKTTPAGVRVRQDGVHRRTVAWDKVHDWAPAREGES